MSDPIPFEGPNLKANWGAVRTEELKAIIREFVSSEPYRTIQEGNRHKIAYKGTFPSEIPLVLGDAVHNLRTALDLLACDLVRLNGQSAKGVHFPFAESEDGLDEQIKKKKFDRASPEAVRLLKKIRPYRGGNVLLRALHELDVMDKHRLIIPAYHNNYVNNLEIEGRSGRISVTGARISNGVSFQTGESSQVTNEDIVTQVMFGAEAPQPLPTKLVFETLEAMKQEVCGVIEAFAKLCLGGTVFSVGTDEARLNLVTPVVPDFSG